MNILTLKPELTFELTKLCVLRESYIQRLQKTLKSKKNTNAKKGSGTKPEMVDVGLGGLFDVLRQISIEVVDTIRMWERTQVSYPNVAPYTWNGENYLQKMINDLEFVDEYGQVTSWLGFSLAFNPFIVPPEVLTDEMFVGDSSVVVFGRRPDEVVEETAKGGKKKFTKSPYTTPIINDPEVFAHLSVKNQLNQKFKRGTVVKQKPDDNDISKRDPYESYLSAELVAKIRMCWKILHKVNAGFLASRSTFNDSFQFPSSSAHQIDGFESTSQYLPASSPLNDSHLLQMEESMFASEYQESQQQHQQGQGHHQHQQHSHLGSHALHHSQTISHIELEEEDFKKSKDQFYQSLYESSGVNYSMMDARNNSLRMSQVSIKSTKDTASKSQIWTPHEIHMQRQVQRRGGELYVLTAAGTKGRMKAPWRRTRFERLETDLSHMNEQYNAISMALEDIYMGKLNAQEAAAAAAAEAPSTAVPPRRNALSGEPAQEEAISRASSPAQPASRKSMRGVPVDPIVAMDHKKAILEESKKDVALRKTLMAEQLRHFKMVASGGALTELQKQRHRLQLSDGQTLEVDEKVSMSIEDMMAMRIQRRVRITFGNALRRALRRKRHNAAQIIQGMWRRAKVHMTAKSRSQQLRLAIILQRLYRGGLAGETMKVLKREAEERVAALNIQRAFRGYQGRKRLNLKREFVKCLHDAEQAVSLRVLLPSHVEDLADVIELFVRDYTLDLPTCVLTVLRAVLYMFNGDASECVAVSAGGYTEKKYIKASIATWHGVKLILRRKGRLLRRLRALIKNSRLPNPSTLKFTPECAAHLTEMVNGIQESEFDELTRGKFCIVQLYHYCRNLKRAFDLQDLFPEYFDPGMSGWFRKLLKIRTAYDRADLERRTQSRCKFRLEEHKRAYGREGKRWKPVGDASTRNNTLLEDAKQLRKKTLARYNANMKQLEASEAKRVHTLQGIERSKALGLEVAIGDLKEYLRLTFIPDEVVLKDLHANVDDKTISLLQTRADLIITTENNERNARSRDFEKLMKFKKLHDLSSDLGVILADLMVLLNRWNSLVESIGGTQYIKDLVGVKKAVHDSIRSQALQLMEQRREINRSIDEELQAQYDAVIKIGYDACKLVIEQHWDLPTHVEISAEDEENRECCRRDADFELRQKRQTAFVSIPPAPFHPVLVIIDARIPRNIKSIIVETLGKFDYVLCTTTQDDPNLYNVFQAIIDSRRHIIFFANRGSHAIARLAFMSLFNSLLNGLIPRPHVLGVDASKDLHIEDWFSDFALDQKAMSQVDINSSIQCDLSIGKLRKFASKFRKLLMVSKPGNKHMGVMPHWLKPIFIRDFKDFIACLTNQRLTGVVLSSLNDDTYANIVLACTFACIFEFWTAPLTEWKDEDVIAGCRAFRQRCKDMSYQQLCDLLALKSALNTLTIASRRVDQSTLLTRAWKYFETLDFHVHPARYLLVQWVLEFTYVLHLLSIQGGQSDGSYRSCEVAYVRNMEWKRDVLFNHHSAATDVTFELTHAKYGVAGEELAGDLLYECLKFCKIYEDKQCTVKYYYDKMKLDSTEEQSVGSGTCTQHVCVYQSGDDCFVSVRVTKTDEQGNSKLPEECENVHAWKYFSRMKVKDMINMLQPNNTEIFEGRVKKYNISETGTHKWYELLSQWACLDNIGEKFQITLLRARFLILSKLGTINGYFVRMEIFEEKFGEVRILVYGILPDGGAINYECTREVVYRLLNHCDPTVEKDGLEALDTQSIAYIFSDRLEVKPSRNWQHFLQNGELIPENMQRTPNVHLRLNRGPGRLVGRKVLLVGNATLLITIYEIDNETSSHELRVVLYEKKHSQTSEFRISPMERLMLFTDDLPILDQICSRVRVVFCDQSIKTRVLLSLPSDFVPTYAEFEIEGDEEYDIMSSIGSGSLVMESSTFTDHLDAGPSVVSEGTEEKFNHHIQSESLVTESLVTEGGGGGGDHNGWQWSLYFNRAIVSELRGNLLVSTWLSVTHGGFVVTVFDQRTLKEVFRFITYFEFCVLFSDKTVDGLLEDLSNLDETVAFDLMDDLMSLVEVTNSDEEGLAVVLTYTGDMQDGRDDVIVARLKPHVSEFPDTRSKKRHVIPMQNVEINIFAVKDLTRMSNFGSRNSTVIVKWNLREVGRTPVQTGTIQPVWDSDNSFRVVTQLGQHIKDCSLDIEVWDTNGKDITEFLGCIRYTGIHLVRFLDHDDRAWHELCKSKRLNDKENANVHGSIEVQCRRWEHVHQFQSTKSARMSIKAGKSERFATHSTGAGGEYAATSTAATAATAAAPPSGAFQPQKSVRISESKTVSSPAKPEAKQHEENSPPHFARNRRQLDVNAKAPTPLWENAPHSAAEAVKEKHEKMHDDDAEEEEVVVVQPVPGLASGVDEPIPIVTKQVLPPLSRFHLSIISLQSLPAEEDIFVTLKFNDTVVLEFNEKSNDEGEVFYTGPPLTFTIPAGYTLGANSLRWEVSSKPDDKPAPTLLCYYDVRGSSLIATVEKTTSLTPRIVSMVHFAKDVTDPPVQLEIYSSLVPIFQQKYAINVLGAKGIAKADAFGKSDPYCKILFNRKEIGRTKTINNTLNPDWEGTEIFELVVPVGKTIDQCRLEIEMYDHDMITADDFLGCKVLEGQELVTCLEFVVGAHELKSRLGSGRVTKRGLAYALTESTNDEIEQSITVKGDLELIGHAIPLTEEQEFILREARRLAGIEAAAPLVKDVKRNILEAVQNETGFSFLINVHSARGLAQANLIGKSDPFVEVSFNGRVIGQTRVKEKTLDPRWGLEAVFELFIPRGCSLEGCTLLLEVYDLDRFRRNFLGSRLIDGKELAKQCKQILAFPPPAGRRFVDGTFYQLEKSTKFSVKENEKVQGDVEVRFHMPHRITPAQWKTYFAKIPSMLHADFTTIEICDLNPSEHHLKPDSDVKVAVLWNGQEVSLLQGIVSPTCTSVTFTPGFDSFAGFVNVKDNVMIEDCLLELVVWKDGKECIGEVFVTGEQLLDLSDKHVRREVTFLLCNYSRMTTPPAPMVEGEIVNVDASAKLKLKCTYSDTMPNKIVLSGRAYEAGDTGPIENKSYPLIRTPLPDSNVHWKFYFGNEPPAEPVVPALDIDAQAVDEEGSDDDDDDDEDDETDDEEGLTVDGESGTEASPEVTPQKSKSGKKSFNDKVTEGSPVHRQSGRRSTTRAGGESAGLSQKRSSSGLSPKRDSGLSPKRSSGEVTPKNKDNNSSSNNNNNAPTVSPKRSLKIKTSFNDSANNVTDVSPKRGSELSPKKSSQAINKRGSENGPKRSAILIVDNKRRTEDAGNNAADEGGPSPKPLQPRNSMMRRSAIQLIEPSQTSSEMKEAEEEKKKKAADDDEAAAEAAIEEEEPLAPSAIKLKAFKLQLELPAMNFTLTVREILDDHRTCWRGRVMPKNFIAPNETAKKAVMQTRASRLVKMKAIKDMQVLAEIHYLSQTGDEEGRSDLLPICVKEILTPGPGLVKRLYRVEVSANNGLLMGSAEIADDEEDFKRLVGRGSPPDLLAGPKKQWKLGAIFEYIVKDRLILDMMPAHKRGPKEHRREGVVAPHKEHEHPKHATDAMDVTGSLITLIRDPPTSEEERPSLAEEEEDENALRGRVVKHIPGSRNPKLFANQSMTGERVYWKRIHSKTHRLTGRTFLSLVILQGTNLLFGSKPDVYFKMVHGRDCLDELNVLFRCKDTWSKEVVSLFITGPELKEWLPKNYVVDLSTKFRRGKFGAYLIQYLALKYHENEDFEMYLIKEDAKNIQLSTADLLAATDEPDPVSKK